MGYLQDYSMSERAAEAYANGEMPLSKWTKKAILAAMRAEKHAALATELEGRQYTLAFLKALFLSTSSWHHTSSKYNSTEFYTLENLGDDDDAYIAELPAQLADWQAAAGAKEEKEVTPWRKGKLVWQQWEQMRGRRGRYVQRSAAGWVRHEGDWLCLYDGRGKNRKLITRRSMSSNSNPRFEK